MRDNINEIQKTILKTIINGDIDVRELSFLDFNIFWRYKNIFNTILKIDKDQLKKEWLLHSEFAKIDENNNIIDIISCDYYSANPYRDIEYLCKTTLIQNNLPVDEAIQQYKKLESIRLELFKKWVDGSLKIIVLILYLILLTYYQRRQRKKSEFSGIQQDCPHLINTQTDYRKEL